MRRLMILIACALTLQSLAVVQTANAETLQVCETSADYTLAPLDPGISASAKELQGVWIGSWSAGPCAAVIVESITPSGDVQAWYVVASFHQWGIGQAQKNKWAGKLTDNKIVFKGGRSSFDLTLVNATKADALWYNSSGQYKGSFTKH